MIQLNLLPDVKLAFIKTRRIRRLVSTAAIVTSAATIGLALTLFLVVNVAQKQHLSNLSRDIDKYTKKLQEEPGLDKILTVQNQLNNLTGLHEDKASASRIYAYISQITPAATPQDPGFVKYESISIDFSELTMKLIGSADTIKTVNKFVDTLKFTTFTSAKADAEGKESQDAAPEAGKAFTGVVLSDFGRDTEGATFEINLSFDERIFDNTLIVKLTVPDIVTTRSVIERPGSLLRQNTEPIEEGEE